jgi:hypothetical protein
MYSKFIKDIVITPLKSQITLPNPAFYGALPTPLLGAWGGAKKTRLVGGGSLMFKTSVIHWLLLHAVQE